MMARPGASAHSRLRPTPSRTADESRAANDTGDAKATSAERVAERIEREHVADLDAVGATAVDADDLQRAGFADASHAAVDPDDAAAQLRRGRVRRIAHRLRRAGGNEVVAGIDFLHRACQ